MNTINAMTSDRSVRRPRTRTKAERNRRRQNDWENYAHFPPIRAPVYLRERQHSQHSDLRDNAVSCVWGVCGDANPSSSLNTEQVSTKYSVRNCSSLHFQILYQPINPLPTSVTLAAARGRPSTSSFPSSHNQPRIDIHFGRFQHIYAEKILVCSIRHVALRHNTFLPDSSHLTVVVYIDYPSF